MKTLVFLTIWIGIAQNLYAQSAAGRIFGSIKEKEKKVIDMATIALLTVKDSVVVKTIFSEPDGKYSFRELKKGSYQIRISAVGYTTYRSGTLNITEPAQIIDMGMVALVPAVNNLKEISITSTVQKAFIERKIDKTVVNVDALISNAGTTALEVLEKSPGVSVDQNGVISLRGKNGVVIFIDDKPTYLSGADLQSYLQSLPSGSLDQIEIMTNPPAKYDASGNAGIINIKTKKGKVKGFNGGLNLGITQGQLTRSSNSFNFNYRDKKLNLFGSLSDYINNSFSQLDLYRKYKNEDGSTKSYFDQDSYFKRRGNTLSGKLGLDYYQSEKTTWGIVLTGMTRQSTQLNDNTSNLYNSNRQLDSIITAFNKDVIDFNNKGINLNYRYKFDKEGQELTFDADYLNYRNQTMQIYDNVSYFANGLLKYTNRLNGDLPARINIYSLKTDYTTNLKAGWKFATGLKSSFTKTDNTADYFNTVNSVTRPDYDKSNHFIYKEQINAGYMNFNKETKTLSVQVGLRFENTLSDGHQYGNIMKRDSVFKRNYNGLFPTVYLSYKLDTLANHQIGFNYGRRIDRPYYEDLNPFLAPLDKFTYYVGNPFLKPAYIQSFELSHTYKNNITTTLSYSRTKDEVNETIEIVNQTYYYSRPANIGVSTLKSLSVDGTQDLTKWLKINLFAQLAQNHAVSDFYTGKLDTKGVFYHIKPTFQFKFGADWSAELSGFYRSKVVSAQFISGAVKEVRAAVMKKISPSTTIKLALNDIFYTRINKGVVNNLALTEASYRNVVDSRSGTLSLSYRFGKAIENLRKHTSTGAESEQNRIKN